MSPSDAKAAERQLRGKEPEPSVLHVDMDAFFASVEVLRDPSLAGKPVLVGGTGPRGVVAAASYEARVFGARSAMPMSTARRLCPSATILAGNHDTYRQVSGRIMSIFADVTPVVGPLSLDEAFLDVTSAHKLFGPAAKIGRHIQQRILAEEGLRCSVGAACSKHVAKLASSAAKPRIDGRNVVPGSGVVVVSASQEQDFLRPLPIRAMWGIGPKTAERLARLGVATIGEVADLDIETVVAAVGEANGRHLHALANGHDDRSVESERKTKSISQERTFAHDLTVGTEVDSQLAGLADLVATRLRESDLFSRTISIKVRLGSFETITRSSTLPSATASSREIAAVVKQLMSDLETDRAVLGAGIRLLGVAASGLGASSHRQLSLGLVEDEPGGDEVDGAVDAIRSKFGKSAIGRGGLNSDLGTPAAPT